MTTSAGAVSSGGRQADEVESRAVGAVQILDDDDARRRLRSSSRSAASTSTGLDPRSTSSSSPPVSLACRRAGPEAAAPCKGAPSS
jgi:hypothetical protein